MSGEFYPKFPYLLLLLAKTKLNNMRKILLTAMGLATAALGLQAQSIVSENFESGMPSGWTQTTLATDGGWNAGSASSLSSSYFSIESHTNILATNDDGCNCDKSDDVLMTSAFDLSNYSGESIRLSFDLFFFLGTYQGATESFEVMARTGTNAWTNVYTAAGATGWQNSIFVDLSSYAGMADVQLAFVYNDGGGWTYGAGIDNVVVEVPAAHDIKLAEVTVPPYSATDVPQVITGQVTNLGSNSESAITVSWTDGTTTHSATLSGTVAPGESMAFEHPDGIALASGENISVSVTATVANDADSSNNTLAGYDVEGVAFWPIKAVVGEEATGTWCGWCPRGMVGMEYMEEEHGEDWIGIAVHNNDPMENSDYDTWMGTQISGYPSGMVDREGVIDPNSAALEAAFEAAMEKFGLASIELLPLIDENDEVEIRATLKFAVDVDMDMALGLFIVEDGLTGSSSDWAQVNYYSGGGNGQLSGAGFDWHNEAGSVTGVTYNDVAREALTDVEGESGIIPSTVEAGGEVSYVHDKFTWDSDYSKENSTVVLMLIDETNGEVINAAESPLIDVVIYEEAGVTYYVIDGDTFQVFEGDNLVPLGTEEIASVAMGVYPNPATDWLNIVSADLTADATVRIYDMMGKVVWSQTGLGVQSNGVQDRARINIEGLSVGLYTIEVSGVNYSMNRIISVTR